MKQKLLLKTMLLLCALIAGSSSVWAEDADLTLDFTSAWTSGDDNSDGEKVFTKTVGTTTYTISGTGGTNFDFKSGYFFFGKSGAYVKLPKVDFDVEKIEVVGNAGASAAVVHNIFVGNTAASTAVTGLGTSSAPQTATTSSFTIGTSYQAANTQYILKVTSNHNAQVTYIKYYKKTSGGGGSTVHTPTFEPTAGTYTSAQNVTLGCETGGATIHYTMTVDGSTPNDPTESDATYSTAISVTKSGTKIKAKAFKAEMTASSVASVTYTIKPNAPTITGGANVTITGDDGLTFYYTTNNSAPTNSSTEYTGAFTPGDCTIKAIAYDTYGNSSAVTTLKYKYMPLAPKNINSGYYVKVADVDDLENGDAILIVYEGGNVALGPQNGNNCPQKTVAISSSTISNIGDAQKLVLVKKNEAIDEVATDVFYFYTGSAYLYAASSSSNHLKTEATPDDNNNARATISITSGDATIKFTGTNSRKWLKYNSASSLFSCYKSDDETMALVQIYKEVPGVVLNSACNDGEATPTYYGTFCNSNAFVVPSGLTVSEIKIDEGKLNVTNYNTGETVPANTGVMVSSTTSGYHAFTLTTGGTSKLGAENMLKPSGNAGIDAASMNIADTKFYRLTMHNGTDIGFWWGAASGAAFDLAANKAYLAVPTGAGAPSMLWFDNESTGVDEVKGKMEEVRGDFFDLQGRKVANPTKGLYIVNGKKVVIK